MMTMIISKFNPSFFTLSTQYWVDRNKEIGNLLILTCNLMENDYEIIH